VKTSGLLRPLRPGINQAQHRSKRSMKEQKHADH